MLLILLMLLLLLLDLLDVVVVSLQQFRPRLTCHPNEGLEKKYQTLDLGDSAWEEQAKKFLSDMPTGRFGDSLE